MVVTSSAKKIVKLTLKDLSQATQWQRRIIPQKECAKNTLKIHSETIYRMSNKENLHINGSSHILFVNYFFS